MADIETIVIGAGVVGLATAAALAASGQEVVVLEREKTIGQGVSSRNSEVIHAGIYYAAGSLKAQLCVRGKTLLYRYCSERNIPYNRTGKLIVATGEGEIEALKTLQLKAFDNGVDDIDMISGSEAIALQPGLKCVAALNSPSTGIIDSHALMISLQADIEHHKGMVVCNSEVQCIEVKNKTLQIRLDDGSAVTAGKIINCCGLNAVPVARTLEEIDKATIPDAKFAKGNYFKLAVKAPFTQLIYPAPVVGGLGIHLTIDLAGQQRFGPDVEWLNEDHFDYQVDPSRANSFYAAIRNYWPDLPDNSLVPDYAGIRPKIVRNDTINIDFEFSTEQHHGVSGLINMYGIESPGLTSSLAIAEFVRDTLL